MSCVAAVTFAVVMTVVVVVVVIVRMVNGFKRSITEHRHKICCSLGMAAMYAKAHEGRDIHNRSQG